MARDRLTYEQAQAAVRAAGWKTQAAYRKNWRQIPGLPSAPELVYPEWRNWRDFLDTGRSTQFLPLAEASQAVQALGIRTLAEYERRYRETPRLPSNPHQTYPGWKSWGEFLGTGRTRRGGSPLPFDQARELARSLRLQTRAAYLLQAKEDARLPTRPDLDSGWQGWPDFLGFTPPVPVTYAQAQSIVRELGIADAREYHRRYREHPELPSSPHLVYSEWETWTAFLGERPAQFLSYQDAAAAARRAGITSFRKYTEMYRSVPGLPSTPNKAYPEWRGWKAFLDSPGV